MLKLLLTFILLISTLWSEEPSSNGSVEKDLYLTYEQFPEKLYINQLFSISTKVVNANQELDELWRELASFDGLKVLQADPISVKEEYTTYDTFFFKVTKALVKTPDIFYKLLRNTTDTIKPKKLAGKFINTVQLQYDDEYCHILARSFEVKNHKTTHYDNTNNIIVFSVIAQEANIEDFNLTHASYQGFESY